MIEFDEELIRNHYIENIEKLSSGTALTPWEMINYFCRWQFDSFKSAYASLKEENDKLRAENERLQNCLTDVKIKLKNNWPQGHVEKFIEKALRGADDLPAL